MEVLVTLVLIGLVIFLLPYIITVLLAVFALVIGVLALFMAGLKKLFG